MDMLIRSVILRFLRRSGQPDATILGAAQAKEETNGEYGALDVEHRPDFQNNKWLSQKALHTCGCI